MIDPKGVAFFIPRGLSAFKEKLFIRIGERIVAAGGRTVRGDHDALARLPTDVMPIVGAAPYLLPLVQAWRADGRPWIGWDRGYARRIFATWLPRGENGGYYRWTLNAYQMRSIREVPGDRWAALNTPVAPWARNGRHIVVANPTPTYSVSHPGLANWTDATIDALSRVTDRQIVIRGKESKRPLQHDLEHAHALVAHGSNAAVEAVILGCPVFVDPSSAAALVGLTDLTKIERPIYPDRQPWLNALAYSQWNETELIDGTLWRLLT